VERAKFWVGGEGGNSALSSDFTSNLLHYT